MLYFCYEYENSNFSNNYSFSSANSSPRENELDIIALFSNTGLLTNAKGEKKRNAAKSDSQKMEGAMKDGLCFFFLFLFLFLSCLYAA